MATIAAGAPVGGFYACPALLQTFQPGTLVDADPVTGIRTTVGQADGSSVQLVAESNAERRTLTYDLRSGCLTFSLTEQQHAGGAVTAQWLQLRHTWWARRGPSRPALRRRRGAAAVGGWGPDRPDGLVREPAAVVRAVSVRAVAARAVAARARSPAPFATPAAP